MNRKQIEKAKKNIAKWESKAEELASQIKAGEQSVEALQAGLGEVVINGGNVDKATGEIEKTKANLEALKAGYTAAILRAEAGRSALEKAEKTWAEGRINEIRKSQDKTFEDVKVIMKDLAEKNREIADLAGEAYSLRMHHGLNLSVPYERGYWQAFAGQAERISESLERVGPGITNRF